MVANHRFLTFEECENSLETRSDTLEIVLAINTFEIIPVAVTNTT